jgi:hypothetical protein
MSSFIHRRAIRAHSPQLRFASSEFCILNSDFLQPGLVWDSKRTRFGLAFCSHRRNTHSPTSVTPSTCLNALKSAFAEHFFLSTTIRRRSARCNAALATFCNMAASVGRENRSFLVIGHSCGELSRAGHGSFAPPRIPRNTPAQNEATKSATNPTQNHAGDIKTPLSLSIPHPLFDETNPPSRPTPRNPRNTHWSLELANSLAIGPWTLVIRLPPFARPIIMKYIGVTFPGSKSVPSQENRRKGASRAIVEGIACLVVT